MKCEIVHHAVSIDGYSAGAARVLTQCQTHGIHDIVIMDDSMLCAVGKIEQAVEDGLAAIEARLKRL
jgi:hypothetical protein